MQEVLVNCLFKLAQEKVWLGELTWEVKQQNKQTKTEYPVIGIQIRVHNFFF